MLEELKRAVCKANIELQKQGLVILTWGNLSALDEKGKILAIKPSGVPYDSLRPEDIVLVNLDGNIVEGNNRPSSDTPTHIELYKNFAGIKSIVHTHSTFATIFAQAKKPIDCLGTTQADYFFGSVPVTRDLSKAEIENNYEKNTGKVIAEHFLKNKIDPLQMPACLVASHGPFVFAESIASAIEKAVILEQIAKMNLQTQRLNEKIVPIGKELLEKHFFRKHGKNAYYGQPQK